MTADKRKRTKFQPVGRWIRPEKRLAIYLRDEFRCLYCKANLHHVSPADITLDHLDPKSNGGFNEPSNLVTACRSCNSSRQDRPWKKYASGRARRRIKRSVRRSIDVQFAKAMRRGRLAPATRRVA